MKKLFLSTLLILSMFSLTGCKFVKDLFDDRDISDAMKILWDSDYPGGDGKTTWEVLDKAPFCRDENWEEFLLDDGRIYIEYTCRVRDVGDYFQQVKKEKLSQVGQWHIQAKANIIGEWGILYIQESYQWLIDLEEESANLEWVGGVFYTDYGKILIKEADDFGCPLKRHLDPNMDAATWTESCKYSTTIEERDYPRE